MDYNLLSDEQILSDLAARFDELRRTKHLKDTDVAERGGTSRRAVTTFRRGSNISLQTFIRLLRGMGELQQLDKLLSADHHFSPIAKPGQIPARRVRGKKPSARSHKWGDEQ